MSEEERRICAETLVRTHSSYALMEAEQKIINVAMVWYLYPEPQDQNEATQERLHQAVKSYHDLLTNRSKTTAPLEVTCPKNS